jgi:hypothetical protein
MSFRAWQRRRRLRQIRRMLLTLPLELRVVALAIVRATPK